MAGKKQKKDKVFRISNREREDWLQVHKFHRGFWDNISEGDRLVKRTDDDLWMWDNKEKNQNMTN